VDFSILAGSWNGFQPSPEDIQQAERQAANEILGKNKTVEQLFELVENARSRLAALIAPILAEIPMDCRPGCAWCCHLYVVMTTIPELLVIAEHLRSTLAEAELADVRQRTSTTLERRRSKHKFQPAVPFIPCPLLVDDRCSVYEVRPLVCQAWYSADIRLCQQSEGGLTANQDIMRLFSGISVGLSAALADHGLECREVELIAALEIALNAPDVTQRWLAGESLFAAAEAPPVIKKLAR